MRRSFTVGILVVAIVLIAGYGFLCWQRYETIREVLAQAQAEFPGNRIDALLSYLDSNDVSLREQNRVIWVLGELRDSKALEDLRALNASETCDHDKFVCQREVHKAIRKITGETPNPYFWQRFDDV
ncbi:MAG: hypothetical protein JSW58_05005 [Candidatus Latescibacterota bacterium]|nr:MAG: hypothetical protein JSW58_05005 [Candidatus Latescibacterota bacterium]